MIYFLSRHFCRFPGTVYLIKDNPKYFCWKIHKKNKTMQIKYTVPGEELKVNILTFHAISCYLLTISLCEYAKQVYLQTHVAGLSNAGN
jgi:uncharacterized protein involved in cysteine biosynthesis